MQKVIPDLLKSCTAEYPDIHFTLDEMSNQAQLESIAIMKSIWAS